MSRNLTPPAQLVTLLSLKFRGVRQNYREALYIGFAMGLNTTVWVFWILTGLVVPEPYRDLCSSAGILASALVTFTVMFLPKGRQLAMGQDTKIEVGLTKISFFFNFFKVLQSRITRVHSQPVNPIALLWTRRCT